MKKECVALLLAGAVLLSGCANLFAAEYSYTEPYSNNIGRSDGDATEISNYNMLKSALVDLINRHDERGVFRFSRYNGSVADDLAAACLEVRTANPLGAYAVENLSYDTSRIVAYYTAEIEVTYKKSAEEIRHIVGVSGVPELENRLRETVTAFEDEAVLRVYSAQVDERSIAALVEGFHLSDPAAVVTEPEVEIDSYPSEGINRIYDVRLRYGVSAAQARLMSGQLSARVRELADEMEEESLPALALECAECLYGLLTESAGSFGDTAYGAILLHGADDKGVALAYKALCDALGIECIVVRGNIGDMGAEEHYWNILGLEGAYYHADVSAFGGDRSAAFLLDDAGLWGVYLWDAAAYPACTGSLRYADVAPEGAAPMQEEEAEEAPEEPGPEDDAPPEEEPEEPQEEETEHPDGL